MVNLNNAIGVGDEFLVNVDDTMCVRVDFATEDRGTLHFERAVVGERRRVDRERSTDDIDMIGIDDRGAADCGGAGRIQNAGNIERAAREGDSTERYASSTVSVPKSLKMPASVRSSRVSVPRASAPPATVMPPPVLLIVPEKVVDAFVSVSVSRQA